MMGHILFVALGGGLGAVSRHLVNLAAFRCFGAAFPIGTMIVNILGSFLMGALVAWFALRGNEGGAGQKLFLATGILGGFTTFSTFSLEAMVLWERGEITSAALYVGLSVILSIAALAAGLALVRSFA